METYELPEGSELDSIADAKVEEFATKICKWISERFPDKEINYIDDGDMAVNSDNTKHARQIYVATDLGTIRILPDFKKRASVGMVINMGLVNAMFKEGYDYDYIAREGKIYSDPIPFKESTVEVLGYYLTHKLNLVK